MSLKQEDGYKPFAIWDVRAFKDGSDCYCVAFFAVLAFVLPFELAFGGQLVMFFALADGASGYSVPKDLFKVKTAGCIVRQCR